MGLSPLPDRTQGKPTLSAHQPSLPQARLAYQHVTPSCLRFGLLLNFLVRKGMQHDLIRMSGYVALVTVRPIVRNSISKDLASVRAIESCGCYRHRLLCVCAFEVVS